MTKQRKQRAQGDRQMRVEDAFDRARHTNETNAARRSGNRCKADAVIPAGLEPVELPNTLRDRFAPAPDEVPMCFRALRPGQYIDSAPNPWVEAVTA